MRTSLLVAGMALLGGVQAQVNVTNPGNATPALASSYGTLAAAVSAWNATTAVSGPVTFTVTGNETAPAGGYAITAVPTGTSAVNNVVFSGGGFTITAPNPQASGSLVDAIFKIIGADFVTIQNFTMQENPANTTTTAGTNNMTEWGVALLYASTTNGAQNCTVQNNTIALNRTYQNTWGIYSNSTHSATTITTSSSATTAAGGNHGLKVYGNNISNVNQGIVILGPTAAADMNTGIDIGGTTPAQGNNITNWGTTGTFSGYVNISGTLNCILVRNSIGFNVSYNTLTSSVGGNTVTTSQRAIYVPSFSNTPTGTFSNTINNNNISVQSGLASGTLNGIINEATTGTATSSLTISNNNFQTWGHTAASPTGAATFINNTMTHQNYTCNNNTFTNLSLGTTGSVTFLSASYTMPANGTKVVNGNSIVTAFNKTGAGGTITLFTDNGSGPATSSHQNNNNNFSNITVTGATTIAGWSNTDGGSPTKTVTGNTFSNWTGGTSTVTGLIVSFSGSSTISGNTVSNITSGGTIVGMQTGSGTDTWTNNTIHTLTSTGASTVTGFNITGGTTKLIERNKIYNLEANNASGQVFGIASTSATTCTFQNNLIGDLRTPNANAANPLIGLNITGGTTVNVYYNSVHLAGTSTGALFGSSATSVSTTPTVTFNNNIFVNNSGTAGAGLAVAYRRGGTSLTGYAAASNRNLLYAGTPGTNNLIFYDGTNSDQTISAYKTRVSARDAQSITENPPFLATTGGGATFLHMDPSTATQAESGAAPVAGVTNDYDNDTRNVSTPDIGADEFAGIAADLSGPSITYAPLANTGCPTAPTLSATITDLSGVNVTSGTKPRVYYKRTTTTNAIVGNTSSDDGWKYVEASNGSSPFSFTLDYSIMFGGAPTNGDVIQYFVVAQDLAGTPNLSINSGTFNAAPSSVALTGGAAPIGGSINSYSILSAVANTVTIGAAETYTSLTGAGGLFAAINAGSLTANTTATIVDASVTETGAVALNQIAYGCSGPVTLTIKPQTTATLTGSVASGALIKLNGADNVIIDGSNSGGTDRSLTIANSATTAPCAIWISSLGNGAGAINNTVKNCVINTNAATTSTAYAIAISGSTISGQGGDNDNITIQNNAIDSRNVGVFANGNASVSTGGLDGLLITQNDFTSSGTLTTVYGLQVARSQAAMISLNTFSITTSGAIAPVAISIETDAFGTEVRRNRITQVVSTNTGGYGGRGITVGTGSATSNVIIANNFVAGVNGSNWSSFGNSSSMGIVIGTVGNSSTLSTTTGGVSIFHNSVNMAGSMGTGSTTALTAALYVGSGATALNVRNNIFVNTQTGTSSTQKNYGIYSAAANTSFTPISYNDVHVANTFNGPSAILGFLGSDQGTFAGFNTAFGATNMQNIAPVFTSATDLHLVPASNSSLNALGVNGTGITVDIDGESRPGAPDTNPDMGADEFAPPSCSAATGGTATGSAAFCSSGTPTITASGYSTGIGSGYQWMSSTNIGDYPATGSAVSGQNNPASLTTGAVSTTTYYWLQVTCATNSSTDYSTMVTITINPAPTSVPSSNSPVCEGGTLNLTGGTDIGATYAWTGPNGFNMGSQNPSIIGVTLAANGIYTFVATSAAGCPSAANTTSVVINAQPNAVSVAPPAPSICEGGSVNLSASGGTYVASNELNFGTQAAQNTASTTALGYPAPFTVYYGGQRMQMLILASELTAAGFTAGSVFDGLNFPVVSLGSNWGGSLTSCQSFMVKFGYTTATTISSFQTLGTTVRPAANYTPTVGYNNVLAFSTQPAAWNGTDNVIIETTFSNNILGGTNDLVVQYNSPTAFQSCIVYRNDSQTPATVAASTTVNFSYSARPDFKLTGSFTGQAPFTWTPPASGLDTYAGANVVASPVGTQMYTVTATNGVCTSDANVTVTVQPAPNAGTNGSLTICEGSTVSEGQLFAALGGSPDAGGAWTPTLAGAGVYTYTVSPTAPCTVPATATVTVSEQPLPDAGTNGTLLICINGTPTGLFAQLGGTPDGGGSWSDPSNASHSGTFSPGTDAAGVYTYTVNAVAPCTGTVSATVTVSFDNTDTDSDGIIDCLDNCPNVAGVIGSYCDANPSPNGFTLGQLDNSCNCVAVPCTENVTIELRTDANSDQASWEILDQNVNFVVCSGGGYPPSILNPITDNCCLPAGCYRLRVLDSGGDGFVSGGYQLRESGPNGRRIIDNFGNFSSGSSSAIASTYDNGAFCVPIGTDAVIFSSCDKLDWVNNKFIVAHANAAVSAEYGVTNATSGYEFWFFDPNGSYSFRRFRSHATSDGFGTGATRACHFKINGWINSLATPHIPANVLLNVRVRGRVAGNNLPFGPACLFKIDAALAACPRVKLQDDPANVDDYSCGVTRDFGGASNPNNRIYANPPQPIPTVASNMVRYQFRFRITGENVCIVRPPQTSARMVLNWTTGTPLQCNKTYEVDVRVSLDGGATWCFGPTGSSQAAACADTQDWGKVCLVTINPCAQLGGGGNSLVAPGDGEFTMYPNPNRGDQLFLNVSNVQEGVNTVNMDVYDLTGKRVMARTIAVQSGFVKTNLDLNGDLSGGMYMVNITAAGTAGDKTYTERLVIQP
ncbi:MAG: T9SS type A sorting domain-containing protein [Flavobacteriales bacterium]